MKEIKIEDTRKLYYLVLSFFSPVVGNHTILAEDEEHAKTLAQEMFKDCINFKVVDIYDMDESPHLKKMLQAEGGNNSKLN